MDFELYTKNDFIEKYFMKGCPRELGLKTIGDCEVNGKEMCFTCWELSVADIDFKPMTYFHFDQATEVNPELCTTIAMEECAELIQAISKAKRGKLDRENIIEEMADVHIVLSWLRNIYGISSEKVTEIYNMKAQRVVDRLNERRFD